MSVRVLPSHLINQIAAGEVIERPASVVKELVENALDAKTKTIEVRIEDGGQSLIALTDDGLGMNRQDLELCVERHATSKLSNEDLFKINTMGFRGEALPSIGSVAKLSITSRHASESDAWCLKVEGGKKSPLAPTAHTVGTKIEVRELFFATPARLKFLKASSTELNHITDGLQRLSMAHPEISFSLKDKTRTVFHYSAGSLLDRLHGVMGKEFAENALPLEASREGYHLEGYASLPTLNRANARLQYLFVNGRPIKDKILSGAVRTAYQDFLPRDRHPLLALFLTVPQEAVDVNVHPAKTEVRFKDSGLVRGLLVSGLRHALSKAGHRASNTISAAALGAVQPGSGLSMAGSRAHSGSSATPYRPASQTQTQHFSENCVTSYQASLSPSKQDSFSSLGVSEAHSEDNLALNSEPFPYSTQEQSAPQEPLNDYPLGLARAQVHTTFIIAETPDSLVIVDQHAAHERLVYERMKTQMEEKGIQRQILLIPEVVELGEGEQEILIKHATDLEKLGLVIEKFGEKAILVREIPALLQNPDFSKLIKDLVDEFQELGDLFSLKEHINELLGTFSCHGSIRAGRRLSPTEMDAILRQMEKTPYSGQCNHGRPTYVQLSKKEIEKLFERR
ncbi:MAG: DNA mismatch repair endonuclease MutL [bacterium]|nr:DNA mismatch repair endonuclease MutL [bacterium]